MTSLSTLSKSLALKGSQVQSQAEALGQRVEKDLHTVCFSSVIPGTGIKFQTASFLLSLGYRHAANGQFSKFLFSVDPIGETN